MSRNSSGTFTLLAPLATAGAVGSSTIVNNSMNDVATEMTDSLSRSGKGGMLAPLDHGGFTAKNIANGSLATDAPSLAQLQTQAVSHATAVAGTVDAIQITMSPVSTTWTTNEIVRWKSAGANATTTPTISKDGGVTNKTIVKGAGAALAAGDLGASGQENTGLFNGTNVVLITPTPAAGASGSITASGYTQNTNRLLGRTTASAGAIEEISIGAGLTLSAGSLAASGSSAPVKHTTVLTSGVTWTTNANHKWVTVTVIGGGGAGGGSGNNAGAAAGGGGAGGVAIRTYTNLTPNTAYTIAVAAAGGNSTFTDGTNPIAGNGGGGGTSGSANNPALGGIGGTATGGDINIAGQAGLNGTGNSTNTTSVSGAGGSTLYGSGGKQLNNVNAAGAAGTGYGSGSSGSLQSGTTTNGQPGAIIIEEWY